MENKEILSKYNFTAKDGKKYSLLKLYSFAQAYSGDRIAGSIYGVALLSEGNISLSKINFSILTSAKNHFAKLSLNGLKFKASDFYEEANKIWNAFIRHNEGNYLDKVTYTNSNVSNTNLETKGFYVKNMFEDSIELDRQMNTASRIYISEDLEHLKRAHSKWGNDFKIYQKTTNGYEIYQEPKPIEPPEVKTPDKSNSSATTSEVQKLKHKISDLDEENEELFEKVAYYKEKNKKNVLLLGVVASILLLTTITFFFTSDFWSDEKSNTDTYTDVTEFEEPKPVATSTINLDAILVNSNSIDSLKTFIEDFKFASSFDPKIRYNDALLFRKKYNSIKSKADYLKIDMSKWEVLYISKNSELDSISNSLSDKEIIKKENRNESNSLPKEEREEKPKKLNSIDKKSKQEDIRQSKTKDKVEGKSAKKD